VDGPADRYSNVTPRTICPLVTRGSYLGGSSGGRSSMVRRSIFPARLCEEGGKLLEHGGDVVEHLYLVGIGTLASLRAQPCRLISILLGMIHGEPVNKDWLRKFPRHLRSENDIDRFSSISHSARIGDVTDRNSGNDDQGVFFSLAAGTICPPARSIRGLSRPPPECRAGSKAWHAPSTRAHAIIARGRASSDLLLTVGGAV
jgi:hypothetical protein